ncbi:MAG: thiamine pyrophosphate-dependent dehydrogenase E1 component subunit alpha [Dehalococcoidia bacterium]|nr:thiamine pyrophosphate-dependent dehydrogenase E1 component subunit alpha [Dehalococcoidia bacterium]
MQINGRLTKSGLDEKDAKNIYRYMLLARSISEKSWLLTRQGRVLFSMPCDGQEAADVASAYALETNTDFIVPYARSLGAMLVKGMTTQEVMLNMFGKADDPNSGGRQIPMHWGHRQLGIISMGSSVGTTIPRASGVALASKLRGQNAVTMVYFGEGSASEGDFHEGLGFAGVHGLPVVFFCNNNGWATSVPVSLQNAEPQVSKRAQGYGFPGITVDGLDPLAVYQAVRTAVNRARSGDGPTLVEANTIRMMPHSSSDDHLRYRTQEDLNNERKLDPIPLFRDFLVSEGILVETSEHEIRELVDAEVEEAIELADAAPSAAPETAFSGVYAP